MVAVLSNICLTEGPALAGVTRSPNRTITAWIFSAGHLSSLPRDLLAPGVNLAADERRTAGKSTYIAIAPAQDRSHSTKQNSHRAHSRR